MAENDNKKDGKFIQECLQKREDVYKEAKESLRLAIGSRNAAKKLFDEIQKLKKEIAEREEAKKRSMVAGQGSKGFDEETARKRAELKDLQAKLKEQNATTRKFNDAKRKYEQAARSYGVAVREAQKQMKEDAAKATEEKKKLEQRDKQLAVARKRITDMRAAVKKKAEELGKDVKMEELRDSKGNRIFTFQDKDGKYIGVMSAKRGKPLGEYIDATKSAELQALCQDAKDMSKNKKANLAQMIDIIDNRAKLEADIANSKGNKDKSEIKAGLEKPMEIKAPEMNEAPKSVKTPEVRLIPKKKRNGEDSKRHFEAIELVDANGDVFRLTKKDIKEAMKQKGTASASASEMLDYSWNNYVEAAKQGKLSPETVASFFKGKADLGNASVNPKLNVQLMDKGNSR